VAARGFHGGDLAHRFLILGGRRQVGVAEAEVADLVRAVLGLEPGAFFKHLADPGGAFRKGEHFL